MRALMKYIFLVMILLFAVSYWANSEDAFVNYSTSEGLVHKTVNCITQDRDGFLWIGTSNGLSRFDGYSFRNFKHENRKPSSLHGTSVYAIIESKDGKLWLSTEIGIEYFDKKQETFTQTKIPELKNNTFARNIHIDRNGYIWVNNSNIDFLAFDPQTQEVKQRISDIPGISMSNVYQFLVQNDTLYLACVDGIAQFSCKSKQLKFLEKKKLLFCFNSQRIDDTSMVFSFMQEGIYVINTAKGRGRWVTENKLQVDNQLNTVFFDASLDCDRAIWCGITQGIMKVKNDKAICYHHFSEENYFGGGWVTCVFRNKQGNILFGTNENGIYIKMDKSQFFKQGKRLFKGEIGKTEVTHYDVFENASMLYSNHRGVYYCSDYRMLKPNCAQLISKAPATSIYHIDSRICLINSSDTILMYDSRTRQITRLHNFSANSRACRSADGKLWFGTWVGILYGYDIDTKKTYTLYLDTIQKRSIPVFSMYGDIDGSIWLGTVGDGLIHIINPAGKHPIYEKYVKSEVGKNSIGSNIIHAICPDKEGNLWIATNGGGASKFNKRSKTFENFTDDSGLKSNIVEAVTVDNDGCVWFTTNVVTKYNPKTGIFVHFTKSDGVGDSFIALAAKCSSFGDIIIANTSGFVIFNPNKLPKSSTISKPLISGLLIRGLRAKVGDTLDGEVPYKTNITYSRELSLPYTFNSFAIEFASIDFQDSKNIYYEYMLEGLDRGWIPVDTRSRMAVYSSLQPGNYIFKVRASKGDEQWSKAQTIQITIVPPWWKTWWFYTVLSVLIVLCFVLFFLYRMRSLKQRNLTLESIISSRTSELRHANDSLKESTQQLDLKNKSLENNQMVIEMKNKDLLDALQAKDKLINILGHDFKNPLSGIQGVAAMLSKESAKSGSEKMRKLTDTILVSSTALMNQMLMVLDWAQSQKNNIQYSPSEIDMGILLEDSISLMKENARLKNITITTQFEYNSNALIDPRMISTVFRNLLGNAIKFTPRGGKILVLIQEYENGINVTFIDTGIGISKQNQDSFASHNIDSSYGTENEKGSGLGLQICKSFVEKNHGTITLSSTEGEGSVFTISLPKGTTPVLSRMLEDEAIADEQILNTATVLIIEDENSVVEYLRTAFEDSYTVIVAKDGKEGLYIAQNMMPNIIISDIGLPGINGLDLCENLKNNDLTSHIPILLTTSTTGNEIQNKGYLSGADDFIVKPINIFVLKQKVRSLLEIKELLKTNRQQNILLDETSIMPEDFDSKIIKKIIAYIHENLSDLSLDTNSIADNIGMSRTQLWRIFKSSTGKSVGDAIRDIRLQKAMEMLKTGKYRVAEVAYDVGYSDARYFARCFVKVYGKSPSSFIDNEA